MQKLKGVGNIKQLLQLIECKQIDTINVGFPDHYGRLMGKKLDADYFLSNVHKDGTHACNYLLACDINHETPQEVANWSSGYGDYHLVCDDSSVRNHWIDGQALVLTNLYDQNHQLVNISPRNMLSKLQNDLQQQGLHVKCASELEMFMFKHNYKYNYDNQYKDLQPLNQGAEDYNLLLGDRQEELIHAIRKKLKECGIEVETSKGEAGKSQHEINIKYDSPVQMADSHLVFKNVCKHVANSQNKSITFMAKPFEDHPGSSCHIHLSIFDNEGQNIFKGDDIMIDEKTGLKSSYNLVYFLGGWMKHVLDVFPFYAQYVNSYKRFKSSSWAPTNLNLWSFDNRTTPFRIVGQGQSLRIEFRIPGSDANPYLAFYASLKSGLHGINNKIMPPVQFQGCGYDNKNVIPAPKNLETAINYFRNSESAEELLGKEIRDHYANLFSIESNMYNRVITDFEFKRYFDHS